MRWPGSRPPLAFRGLLIALLVPVLLLVLGTVGYMVLEGWRFQDALYMTVITLTTVGFMEVHPLSAEGRLFTMALLLVGVFTLFYAATAIIQAVVGGEVRGDLGRQRMERVLTQIEDHIIVCGFGRMGQLVCAEFSARAIPFVVVDSVAAVLEGFRLPHGIPLTGDATSDEILKRAGVERARCLVTLASSDADNLYITMSARLLSDRLHIVARAGSEEAGGKLARAGASRVVSPYVIGGQRVSLAVLRPAVLDFLELATRHDYLELQIEEIRIQGGSALAGASVKDSRIRQELGIIVVAIKRRDGKMVFNPPPDEAIGEGDVLIALGHREQLDRLESLSG